MLLPQSFTSQIDVHSCGLTIIKEEKSSNKPSLDGKIKKIHKNFKYNKKGGKGIIDFGEFNVFNSDKNTDSESLSVISELSRLDSKPESINSSSSAGSWCDYTFQPKYQYIGLICLDDPGFEDYIRNNVCNPKLGRKMCTL